MHDDAIIEEMRQIKERHAAEYGFNIRAMVRALQDKQRQEGRSVVPPRPRRVTR